MPKIGVILSNVGTPKAPTPKAVGRYLFEFLTDPFVLHMPAIFRYMLVTAIVFIRSKKSAKNYQKIWTPKGSPLLVESQSTALALQQKLGDDHKVTVAMRYGEPSFKTAREHLKDCDEIIYFPQYPQYAESTVETSERMFKKHFGDKDYKIIDPFYENVHFIKAYGEFLKKQLKGKSIDHLLMSFHGLPENHIRSVDPSKSHCLQSKDCCEKAQGDVLKHCYRAQCTRSAKALATALGMDSSQYSLSFQSRVGKLKWIEPYTDATLESLSAKGVKNLAVICPGFPVDGLETLEEIALEGKETFLASGGENYYFVPCLNSDPNWIEACVNILKET